MLAKASQSDAGQVILTAMMRYMEDLIDRALNSPKSEERDRLLEQVNGITGFLKLANQKVRVARSSASLLMQRVAREIHAGESGSEEPGA